MNRLKSLFISSYITAASIAGLHGLWVLGTRGYDLEWLGATLASLAAAGFFARIFLLPTPRTSANMMPLSTFIAIAAALGTSAGFSSLRLPALYSLMTLGGWLTYLFWYSRLSHRDRETLSLGKQLPKFQLEQFDGNKVSSESFLGNPALFLFYRGNWCPFCTTQVRELVDQYRELDAHGVQVALISPQPAKQTQKLALKFDVPFLFLVDPNNQAARALGIDAPAGLPAGLEVLGYDSDTVLPTVVITDAAGKILYADLPANYRLRPEPAEFLRVFQETQAAS